MACIADIVSTRSSKVSYFSLKQGMHVNFEMIFFVIGLVLVTETLAVSEIRGGSHEE